MPVLRNGKPPKKKQQKFFYNNITENYRSSMRNLTKRQRQARRCNFIDWKCQKASQDARAHAYLRLVTVLVVEFAHLVADLLAFVHAEADGCVNAKTIVRAEAAFQR